MAKTKFTLTPNLRKGLPIPFHEMTEFPFQDMCCELLEKEAEIANCNVYGPRGQKQHGIDLLAVRKKNDGREVGQCKCYNKFAPSEFKKVTDEFFKHWQTKWANKKVKRFILFVACKVENTKHLEARDKEENRFKRKKIIYELWDGNTITNKLRTHTEVVYGHIQDDYWIEYICGKRQTDTPSVIGPQETASVIIESSLIGKIDLLSKSIGNELDSKIEAMRNELRKGKNEIVKNWIIETRENIIAFEALPLETKARFIGFEAMYKLIQENDVAGAKKSLKESLNIYPQNTHPRLQALIAHKEKGPKKALAILDGYNDIDSLNLKAAFLLESGMLDKAESLLGQLSKGETNNG